jgi:hypothetical protein
MEHRTCKQPAGQENQNVRREEEANRRRKKRFKLNISKKNHRKKMEFQTATFLPLSFRRPQINGGIPPMPELRNPAPDWITRTRMTTTPKTTQPGHNFWASIVDHPWHAPSCGVSMDGPGSFIHIIGARAQF